MAFVLGVMTEMPLRVLRTIERGCVARLGLAIFVFAAIDVIALGAFPWPSGSGSPIAIQGAVLERLRPMVDDYFAALNREVANQ